MKLGIDLGGTNIAHGVVDQSGQLLSSGSQPLGSRQLADVVAAIRQIYQNYRRDYPIDSVGIGVPGIVRDVLGNDVSCVNLGWRNVAFYDALVPALACDLKIVNDADAACLGEYLFGSLKGCQSGVLLTLGTGVGSGLIVAGQLLSSCSGGAEVGHLVIDWRGETCNCGNRGCLETFVAAPALLRHYNQLQPDQTVSSAKQIFERHRLGEDAARRTVDWFCQHLATGIVNLYNILAPQVVCLSGGISQSFDVFNEPLQRAVACRLLDANLRYGAIVPAALGPTAAIIGAAFLADYQFD